MDQKDRLSKQLPQLTERTEKIPLDCFYPFQSAVGLEEDKGQLKSVTSAEQTALFP